MIRYISLLLVLLLCVTSQSVDNSGSCNNPPTVNCNCGVEDLPTHVSTSSRRNISHGRPGKKGVKGDQGLSIKGQKGQKGEPGTSYDIKKELQHLKDQVQSLISFQINLTSDCYNLKTMGFRASGVYDVIVGNKRTEVYCDMENDGGGWTVIQRRTSNHTDFFRDWLAYQEGFGSIPNNFWLGLETIQAITSSGSYQLRVDLEDFSGNTAYALYSSFSIGNKASNYTLHVSGYSGTAGDSLKRHNNQPFTTKDRDNDAWGSSNCAFAWHGAWWYKDCFDSNLNGIYYNSGVDDVKSMSWYHWKRNRQSMKRAEMKIKPN